MAGNGKARSGGMAISTLKILDSYRTLEMTWLNHHCHACKIDHSPVIENRSLTRLP